MYVGDKVWIFDNNHRIYKDENGNELSSPWYRGHFVERLIIGETKASWIIGYENSKVEDKSSIKVNKKTLQYKAWNGNISTLYTCEDEIDQICWVNDNQYAISNSVSRCHDYDKLMKIKHILED